MDDESVRQVLSLYEGPKITDQGIVFDSSDNANMGLVMRVIPEKPLIEQRADGLLQWLRNEDLRERQVVYFTDDQELEEVKVFMEKEGQSVTTRDNTTLVINDDKVGGDCGTIIWGDPPTQLQQLVDSGLVMWFAPSRWFPEMIHKDRDDEQVSQVLQALKSDMPPAMLRHYVTDSLDELGVLDPPSPSPRINKIKVRREQNRATVARRGKNKLLSKRI